MAGEYMESATQSCENHPNTQGDRVPHPNHLTSTCEQHPQRHVSNTDHMSGEHNQDERNTASTDPNPNAYDRNHPLNDTSHYQHQPLMFRTRPIQEEEAPHVLHQLCKTQYRDQEPILKNTRGTIQYASLNIKGWGANLIYNSNHKWLTIHKLLKAERIRCLAIQETHLNPTHVVEIQGSIFGNHMAIYTQTAQMRQVLLSF